MLVDNACPERLGELVRALLPTCPDLEVHTDVRCVESAQHGATLVLAPSAADADWLNLQRPIFARRELRVVLWCDAAISAALARNAVDFFDWISHRHECPPGRAAHGVAGIRCALAARAPGIVWADGDLNAAFQAARPRRELRPVSAGRPYGELVAEVAQAGSAWLAWTDVHGPFQLRRARWAMAEAGRSGRAILVQPAVPSPGWWPIHGRSMQLAQAQKRLAQTRARAPGRLAALTMLEPEAVELAAVLLQRGVSEAALAQAIQRADDPGAALALMAQEQGVLSLEEVAGDVAVPPALRALGRDPVVDSIRAGRWVAVDEGIARSDHMPSVEVLWWAARSRCAPPRGSQGARPSATRATIDDLFNSAIRGSSGRAAPHNADAIEVLLRERPTTSTAWSMLASVALASGEVEVASRWASHAVGLADPPSESWLVLGRVLEAQGRLTEAETMIRRVLEGNGDQPRAVADQVQYQLAWNVAQQGKYEEAERILRDQVSGAEEAHGAGHPGLWMTLQSLALVLQRQGRHAEAEAMLRRVLATRRREHDENTLTASIMHDLAVVLHERGKHVEAQILLEDALAMRQHLLGSEHPASGESMRALATTLAAQGRYEAAEWLLRRAVAVADRALTAAHPAAAAARRTLADVLQARGKYEEAEGLLGQALVAQERAFGPYHRDVCLTLASLAEVLSAMGRKPEALAHAQRALEIAARAQSPEEPRLHALVDTLSRATPPA